MKQTLTDLPTCLESGDVCIQAEDWGDINVARIAFRGAPTLRRC